MPKPVAYDLSQISAHIVTYSDRIQRGTKEDRATPACTAALAEAGLGPVTVAAIPESADRRLRSAWSIICGRRLPF